jgi:hypothetical protein
MTTLRTFEWRGVPVRISLPPAEVGRDAPWVDLIALLTAFGFTGRDLPLAALAVVEEYGTRACPIDGGDILVDYQTMYALVVGATGRGAISLDDWADLQDAYSEAVQQAASIAPGPEIRAFLRSMHRDDLLKPQGRS